MKAALHRKKIFVFIFLLVFLGTLAAGKFASGYRLDLSGRRLNPTGLLAVTSEPKGALVFVNDKLKTATDDALSLPPGDYLIKITKEGFFPWQKNLKIKKGLVTKTEAFLFPQVPDLKPLTFSEAKNPQISPDGSRLLYLTPLPDLEAGLWTIDLTDFLFSLGRSPKQIGKSTSLFDFGKAKISWSPDSRQILVEFAQSQNKYLLDPGQYNPAGALVNITESLPAVQKRWFTEEKLKEEARLKKLPEKLIEILDKKTNGLVFSPDNTKILYTATASAEIPEKLIPPLPATSTQKENRKLEPDKIYVYDIKEDKNFLVPVPAKEVNWFTTSRHLFWIEKDSPVGGQDKVVICEYDGTNQKTIYQGPFITPYVFAAPGANRFLILARIELEKDTRPNLYAVTLR